MRNPMENLSKTMFSILTDVEHRLVQQIYALPDLSEIQLIDLHGEMLSMLAANYIAHVANLARKKTCEELVSIFSTNLEAKVKALRAKRESDGE